MERWGALVAALLVAACSDFMGFDKGKPAPPGEAGSSSVASSSESTAASGGAGGGSGGEPGTAGAGGAATPVTRIAFVSAAPTAISPQSGMDAFDAFCMMQAMDDFPPGKQFVAWVSRSAAGAGHVNAKDRIIEAEWYRPDGVLIASSKDDLLDSTLAIEINVKADGNPLGSSVTVWTGTLEGGNDSNQDCSGWLSNDPSTSSATLGASGQKDKDWTHYLVGECNESHHVYCFEE